MTQPEKEHKTWEKRQRRDPHNRKIHRIDIRLTQTEYRLLTSLAEAYQMTLSDYVVWASCQKVLP